MKQELIADVMHWMLPHLDNGQLKQLQNALEQALRHYGLSAGCKGEEENDNQQLLSAFLSANSFFAWLEDEDSPDRIPGRQE